MAEFSDNRQSKVHSVEWSCRPQVTCCPSCTRQEPWDPPHQPVLFMTKVTLTLELGTVPEDRPGSLPRAAPSLMEETDEETRAWSPCPAQCRASPQRVAEGLRDGRCGAGFPEEAERRRRQSSGVDSRERWEVREWAAQGPEAGQGVSSPGSDSVHGGLVAGVESGGPCSVDGDLWEWCVAQEASAE